MIDLQQKGVLPALVSYTVPYPELGNDPDGWGWIRIALRSFHEHFPGQEVLVVDNDSDDDVYRAKRNWLHSYELAKVIRNPETQKTGFWRDHHPRSNHHHGNGLDLAVRHCRKHGYGYLLIFEPDCLIEGAAWADALWQGAETGAWISGFNHCNHSSRIIHVCPSIWDVNAPPCEISFARQPMTEDRQHPRFEDMTRLRADAVNWSHWDTGQRNWWTAALADKVHWVEPKPDDFTHYWSGSGYIARQDLRGHEDYDKLRPYLD
ncbi:MAG: hypothetical protein AAF441_06190 [Pseudomonadota bacterium]